MSNSVLLLLGDFDFFGDCTQVNEIEHHEMFDTVEQAEDCIKAMGTVSDYLIHQNDGITIKGQHNGWSHDVWVTGGNDE